MKKPSTMDAASRFTRARSRAAKAGRYILTKFILVFVIGVGLVFAWPWSTDMVRQPSIFPFDQLMGAPPPGTLPIRGGELRMDEQELHNPIPATSASLEKGKQLFLTYCAVCHGQDAKGKGTVGSMFLVPAPDITVWRPEEYVYTRIRDGGVFMPSYKESLSTEEAWAVVNYVRNLQQK